MRNASIILAITVVALGLSCRIWRDLAFGPPPFPTWSLLTGKPFAKPSLTAKLNSALPPDFKTADTLGGTFQAFRDTGLRIDIDWEFDLRPRLLPQHPTPIRKLGGMKTIDAILLVLKDLDPPLYGRARDDALMIGTKEKIDCAYTRVYDVRGLISTSGPVGLEKEIMSILPASAWRDRSPDGMDSLRMLSGQLILTASADDQLAIANYLNARQVQPLHKAFAIRAAISTSGAVILACLALFVAHRLRHTHVGHCAKCGYDLRASIGRCPECGTEFTGASPTRAETPPAPV